MPELPDIRLYLAALDPRVRVQTLTGVRLLKPFLLRSVAPPLAEAASHRVVALEIVFADKDPNFAGQKAAFAPPHRLKIKGFEVEVCIPPEPGDWLDELLRRRKREADDSRIP